LFHCFGVNLELKHFGSRNVKKRRRQEISNLELPEVRDDLFQNDILSLIAIFGQVQQPWSELTRYGLSRRQPSAKWPKFSFKNQHVPFPWLSTFLLMWSGIMMGLGGFQVPMRNADSTHDSIISVESHLSTCVQARRLVFRYCRLFSFSSSPNPPSSGRQTKLYRKGKLMT
jgi:hypothetical protein